MTETTTIGAAMTAGRMPTTNLVCVARDLVAQPRLGLVATDGSSHRFGGSWRGLGVAGCPSTSAHGVVRSAPVAAGRSVRPVAKVRTYAAAAQPTLQMINRNGKNRTKGSSPWRFPV